MALEVLQLFFAGGAGNDYVYYCWGDGGTGVEQALEALPAESRLTVLLACSSGVAQRVCHS
eukprot:5803230-Amphidinium_carterae.1